MDVAVVAEKTHIFAHAGLIDIAKVVALPMHAKKARVASSVADSGPQFEIVPIFPAAPIKTET